MELNFDNLLNSIVELCSIESVVTTGVEGKPFGEGVAKALDYTLSLSRELGFTTRDYDGYVGVAEVGEGEEFGILAHLDVVPAGKGWTTSPFAPTVRDGKLYARGVEDDKGPLILCMYAVADLMRHYRPTKRIRFVFGLDEEGGIWESIKHLERVDHLPDTGISPDASFPVVNAEKGILHLSLSFPAPTGLKELSGGSAINIVADKAYVIVGSEKLAFSGKPAHASLPEQGENAIAKAIVYLISRFPSLMPLLSLIDVTGKAVGIAYTDESGALTLNIGNAETVDGTVKLGLDIRYPVTMPKSAVIEGITRAVPMATVTELDSQKPLYVEENDPLVVGLLDAYKEVMGEAYTLQIGGGTYARAMAHGVAFGPTLPGEESTCHQVDEYMSIDAIRRSYDIYRAAIKKLCFEE